MKLSDSDFELFKARQYCDEPSCSHYQKVGAGNMSTFYEDALYDTYCYYEQSHTKEKVGSLSQTKVLIYFRAVS